jgi:hypothetical protein
MNFFPFSLRVCSISNKVPIPWLKICNAQIAANVANFRIYSSKMQNSMLFQTVFSTIHKPQATSSMPDEGLLHQMQMMILQNILPVLTCLSGQLNMIGTE